MDVRHHLDCGQCSIRTQCVGSGISSPEFSNGGNVKESRVYFRGEKVLNGPGTEGRYLLRSGLVRVARKLPIGNPVTIDLASAGDMLGYPILFSIKDENRLVEVIDTAELCFVDGTRFIQWLKTSNEARERLIRWVGKEYLRREEQICSLSFRSVRERTAEALLYLAERFGTPRADGVGVPTSLTREDIAALIGTARESVVRQLAEFKDEACIALDGRQIIVKKLDSLRKIAKIEKSQAPQPTVKHTL